MSFARRAAGSLGRPKMLAGFRANAAAPTWEAGRIWVPEDAPWVADFLAELYSFPRGKRDDQVDMLTQLIKHVFIGAGDTGILEYWRGILAEKKRETEGVA